MLCDVHVFHDIPVTACSRQFTVVLFDVLDYIALGYCTLAQQALHFPRIFPKRLEQFELPIGHFFATRSVQPTGVVLKALQRRETVETVVAVLHA